MYSVHVDVYTNHKFLQYVCTQMDLNLRQIRLLKLFKYYDISVLYNPDKAYVVWYALIRMTMGSACHIKEAKKDLVTDVHRLAILGLKK